MLLQSLTPTLIIQFFYCRLCQIRRASPKQPWRRIVATFPIMHYTTLTFMLLWIACSGRKVREQRALLVKRGRTEYLTREHIALPPPSDFPCKVEVVYNDPVSQRVGHLEPAVS